MRLTMYFMDGMMFCGEQEGQKLKDPMQFSIFPGQDGQPMQGMQKLPGNPAWISVKDYGFYYPVTDESIIALYTRATTGLVLPVAPRFVSAMN